jgi:hypothetical protein
MDEESTGGVVIPLSGNYQLINEDPPKDGTVILLE